MIWRAFLTCWALDSASLPGPIQSESFSDYSYTLGATAGMSGGLSNDAKEILASYREMPWG